MKKKITLALFLLGTVGLYAQTGIGTTLPNSTSILDVDSTNKGILIPRVNLLNDTDKTTIKGGDYPESLIVYHNGTKDLIAGFYYWEKKKWNVLISNTNLYEYIKKEAKQDTVMIKHENGDYIFTWKDDKGVEQTMKISDVIKKFETLTEFKGAIEGNEAVLTYKPERGVETKVLLTDLLKKSTDFETYIKSLITTNMVVPTTVVANGSGTEVAKTIDTNSNTTTYKVSVVPTEIDLTGDVGGKAGDNTINKIKKVTVSPTPPTTTGQALVYNDATKVWEPGKPAVNTNDITGKANLTTDGVIVVGDATTGTNSAPNAVLAATTLSIKNASITGGKIAPTTIATGNLVDKAVTVGKIADGGADRVLTTTAAGVAQWEPRANLAVAKANLSTDGIIVVGDAATGTNSAPNAVLAATTLSIKNASITGGKIAPTTIATGNLVDKAVTVGKIADGGADRVLTTTAAGVAQWEPRANLAVAKANLSTDGIIVVGDAATGTNSAPNAVLAATTLSIKNASITGGKIANRTLTANHLAIVEASDFNSVLSTDTKGNPQWFVKGNLTTDNIIVVGKGDSGANTSGHFPLLAPMELSIRNASITGTQIANKAITVGKIADGGADRVLTTTAGGVAQWEPRANLAVTKANLSTDGIIVVGDAATGTNSAPNAVLAATTLSIKNASITGGKIAATTIETGNLANKAVTVGKIADGGADRVLTTTAAGVAQWEPRANLGNIIAAHNGLTKNGSYIELGGTLAKPTTITTSSSNQLMVTGLPTANNKTDNVVMVDARTGALRQTNAVNPSYFYLPPVNITVTPGATNQSLNIYNLYSTQYKNPRAKSNSAASLPVYNATELNYFIIYADPAVFSNIAVDPYGVMTYSIEYYPTCNR